MILAMRQDLPKSTQALSNSLIHALCTELATVLPLLFLRLGRTPKEKNVFNDLTLCIHRLWRTAAAASSVLDRQMEWRGPRFVLHPWIAPGLEKELYGGGGTCSDCAVQGSGAIHVSRIDVSSVVEEALDRSNLLSRIPCRTGDEPVCGVMQWCASAMIACRVRIGTCVEQQADYFNAITGGSQMQQRFAHVNPVIDAEVKQLRGAKGTSGEFEISMEQSFCGAQIIVKNRCDQCVHSKILL